MCPDGADHPLLICPLDIPPGGVPVAGGMCFTNASSCARGTACGGANLQCVASDSCPVGARFSCFLQTAAKLPSAALAFDISGVSAANYTAVATALASLLATAPEFVSITALPGRRRLQTAVPAATASVLTFNPASLAQNISASLVTALAAATHLPLALLNGPRTTQPSAATSLDALKQLLHSASAANITVAAHLDLSGSPLLISPGASVVLSGAFAMCKAGGDPSGTGKCTLDAGGLSQAFILGHGAALVLNNLAVVNGIAAMTGNDPLYVSGGCISALGGSSLKLSNVSFTIWAAMTLCFIFIAWGAALVFCFYRRTHTLSRLRSFSRRSLKLALLFLYFAYMPLSETVLAFFACRQIGDSWYLEEDVGITCYSSTYQKWYSLGIFWTLVYPIGIPVLFFNVLLYYSVPKMARLKQDTEYVRAMVHHCAALNLHVAVEHAMLSRDSLSPEHLDTLWQHFFGAREVSLEAMNFTDEARKQRAAAAAEAAVVRSRAMVLLRSVLRPLSVLKAVLRAQYRFHRNRMLGLVTPQTEQELKLRLLLKHARRIKLPISRIPWHMHFPHRAQRAAQRAAQDSCSFLFEEFFVGAWFWELCELSKKLLVTSVLRFIRPGTTIQIVSGLLLVYTFQQLYTRVGPFTNYGAQVTGYMSFLNIIAFFVLAVVLKTNTAIVANVKADDALKAALSSVLVLAVFVVPVLLAGAQYIQDVRKSLSSPAHAAHAHGEEETNEEEELHGGHWPSLRAFLLGGSGGKLPSPSELQASVRLGVTNAHAHKALEVQAQATPETRAQRLQHFAQE